MSVLVRFAPDATTKEQYDEVIRRLEEGGNWPADGCDYHVCFAGSDGSIRVSEVWDSMEQFEAHGEHLMPILAEVEIGGADPEFLKVLQVTKA